MKKLLNLSAALLLALALAGCGGKSSAALSQGQISAASPQSPSSAQSSASAPDASSAQSSPAPSSSSEQSASSSSSASAQAVKITASPTELKPGGLLVLRAENLPAGVSAAAQTTLDFTPSFFPDGEGAAVALMPVKSGTAPGSYTITVTAGDAVQRFDVQVDDAGFKVEYIEMEQSTADSTLGSSAAADEFEAATRPLKDSADPQVYWEGAFRLPVQQETLRVSSDFGDTRYVNGALNGRHGGVDFPAPEGTPVTATNAGKVLYAGFLKLTGNTVCIEHGLGLKSWYYHMSALSVAAGDMVSTGQEVGRVGTTGASTGPHLHFAFTVNGVFVNPWTILQDGVSLGG